METDSECRKWRYESRGVLLTFTGLAGMMTAWLKAQDSEFKVRGSCVRQGCVDGQPHVQDPLLPLFFVSSSLLEKNMLPIHFYSDCDLCQVERQGVKSLAKKQSP
ncbi:hypothetical protein E2C01_100848 [Portunus trituberculatus]|uniref:Uncharacterized protein n=1 Tax=Portunus trituberculatus TaxID=210409 RepID=A0A5B7KD92_PORTR|nr:hypothetical protein [Portunus trituberculatus]